MKKTNNYYTDVLYLLIGEIIVSFGIVIAYVALGMYQWNILTGAILGSAVTVLNFLILSTQINKAIDKYMELIEGKQLSEEEAAEFAKKHSLQVQNAVTKSYVLRTALMLGSLVIAFITGWFNPLATLIPLLMYKPLIYVIEFIKKKRGA